MKTSVKNISSILSRYTNATKEENMCSHDVVTWKIVSNTVKDRMINNSLIHKFTPTPRIGKRTKVLNTKIKDYNITKNYKEYVRIKTGILRNLNDDTETDDTDSLTDIDYNVMSNSKPMLVKHIAKNSKWYYTSEEEEQICRRKRKTNRIKSNKSKKSVNVGWQQIVKENRNMSRLSGFNSQESTVSNEAIPSKTNENAVLNHRTSYIMKSKSNSAGSDSSSDSENTALSIRVKCMNKKGQKHKYSNAIVNRSNSESYHQDNAINSINKSVEQTHGHPNLINPVYETAVPSLSSPENMNGSVPSINIKELNRLEDYNTEGLMGKNDGSSIKAKDHDDTLASPKASKLVENVKRNLTSSLDNVDFANNEEIEKVQSVKRNLTPLLDNVDFVNNEEIEKVQSVKRNLTPLLDNVDFVNNEEIEKVQSIKKNLTPLLDNIDFVNNEEIEKDQNIKKNLTPSLGNVDFVSNEEIEKDQSVKHESNNDHVFPSANLPLDALVEQQKDSGIDDDSQDKYIKRLNSEDLDSIQNISEEIFSPCQIKQIDEVINDVKDHVKDSSLKSCNGILKEQNSAEGTRLIEDSSQLSKTDNEDKEINDEDKAHFVKLDDSCDVQTKYLQPKITSTEIVHTKYKITSGRISDTSNKDEYNPMKIDTLTSPIAISNDADNLQERTMINITEKQEQEIFTSFKETDYEEEEEDTNYMLLEMKKRQANLNLIVDSDSSESENENKYHMIETSKSNVDSSKTVSSKDEEERSNDDQKSCTSKESTNISCSEDTVLDDIGTCEEGRLENDEENCVFEEHSTPTSDIINLHEDIYADNENECNKSNQPQDKTNISETQTMHLDTSCRYRPCNLQELVEDQELLVERLSPGFTLMDLSEDEEAFLLNVPSKVLLGDLQGRKLILKEKIIKFGKNKYKIKCQKADTITCVFATNKQQKPYKTVNIKEISTITLQERLSHPSEESRLWKESHPLAKSDSLLYHDTNIFFNVRKRRIYSDDDFEVTDEQTDEMESQRVELVKHQKRRRKNS